MRDTNFGEVESQFITSRQLQEAVSIIIQYKPGYSIANPSLQPKTFFIQTITQLAVLSCQSPKTMMFNSRYTNRSKTTKLNTKSSIGVALWDRE